MRRFGLGLLLFLSGCFDFEGALKARCLDGGFTSGSACSRFSVGGGGGSFGGGGGSTGGGGGFTPWTGDGGPMCTEDDWCWENGGADLFALFGTTDSDVWAAGAGGTLIHWNGTRWDQARSLLPRASLPGLQAEPVYRSVAVTDAGEVWLTGGERVLLLTRQTAPAFSESDFYGVNLLAAWNGGVFGMSSQFVDFAAPGSPSPLLSYETFHSMLVNDEGCLVAVNRGGAPGPPFRGVVDCRTDAISLDTTGDGGGFYESALALFSRADAGLGVTGRHGNVFLRDGLGTWLEVPVQGYPDQSYRDNYGELAAATRVGDQVWVVGRLGGVFKLSGPTTSAAVRVPNYNEANLSTAWTSSNGTFWAAGFGGVVVRIDAGTVTTGPSTAVPAWPVIDLWADPQQQVAVLSNADLLVRDAGSATWSRKQTNTAVNWVAGTGWGGRMVLLGTNGQLYQWTLTASDPVVIGPFLDGGISPAGVRSGAFGPVGDGQFVIGAAGVVGVFDARDGGLTRLADPSAPNGPSRIVGVARLSDGRILVAGNEGPFEAEQGGLYEVGDGGWTKLSSTVGALEHMARCPDDSVLVVGQHEFSARYQNGWTPLRTNPSTLHVFNAAWCDQNNAAWVLSETGKVFRYAAGETIELSGWGASADSQFEANVITGNTQTVFIAGGKTAILSKKR